MKRFVVFLLSLVIMLSSATIAYSYNSDYMNVEKWINSDKAYSGEINKAGVFGTLTGYYNCYFDELDNCIYYCFDIDEENIYDNSSVSFEVIVNNQYEEFVLPINEDGLATDAKDIKRRFDVYSHFSTYDDHNGDYIFAVDINDGYDEHDVSVFLHTRGKYAIEDLQDMNIIVPKRKAETTSKSKISTSTKTKVTTTKSVTAKTKDNKVDASKDDEYVDVYEEVFDSTKGTTPSGKKPNVKSSTRVTQKKAIGSRVATTNSTKKNYALTKDTNDNTSTYAEDIEVTAYGEENVVSTNINWTLLFIAIGVALCGLAFIIYDIIVNRKRKRNNETETEDDSDDFDF